MKKLLIILFIAVFSPTSYAAYDDYTTLNSHYCVYSPLENKSDLRYKLSRFAPPGTPKDYIRVLVMNSSNTLIDTTFELGNFVYAKEYNTGYVIPNNYSYRITSMRTDIDTGWISCN